MKAERVVPEQNVRGTGEKANSFTVAENTYWKEELQAQVPVLAQRKTPLWWMKHYVRRLRRILMKTPRELPYKLLHTIVFRTLYKLFCLLPLNHKKVVFVSDARSTMSPNFRFVYTALREQYPGLVAWSLLKPSATLKKTVSEHVRLAYHLATAQVILVDDVYTMAYYLKIRQGAEFIQLWHAVGAFKTFGYSRIGRPGGPSINSKAHRNYTKAVVSSKSVAKHYAEGFGISEDKVIATGIPRTDVFFDEQYAKETRRKIYSAYPSLQQKKVILYAPTFRGHGQADARFPKDVLNLEILHQALQQDYVVVLKLHPFIKSQIAIPEALANFVYDLTDYPDVNELLFVSDIVITDYSSVCFEAALLKRPMVFFAYDLEEYTRTRDFYYRYESFVPGPIVKSTEEIVSVVQNGDFQTEKQAAFVDYFFDGIDGNSTQHVVDLLLKSLG